VSADDPAPSRRSERSVERQPDEGLAAARRFWGGPLGPYLVGHGLLAALLSLPLLRAGWITAFICFVLVLGAQLLIRAHFIRHHGRSGDPQETK
jgi:hypothetical protein